MSGMIGCTLIANLETAQPTDLTYQVIQYVMANFHPAWLAVFAIGWLVYKSLSRYFEQRMAKADQAENYEKVIESFYQTMKEMAETQRAFTDILNRLEQGVTDRGVQTRDLLERWNATDRAIGNIETLMRAANCGKGLPKSD